MSPRQAYACASKIGRMAAKVFVCLGAAAGMVLPAQAQWQEAGPLRFRAVEVDHVPYLRCFGYLFERGDRMVAYSGDVKPCAGLSELARESDVLVLECNGRHRGPVTHMHEENVQELAAAHPGLHVIVTHLGEQVDVAKLDGITVPSDFERLAV